MQMHSNSAEYLQKISKSILNLPTLPTIAARLIDLVDNPKTSASQIGALISEDQVLTARLLKMVNSAYYGLGREVSNVQQAIVLLGFDNVRELSLGVSVLNAFRSAKGNAILDMNAFWDHSAYVGLVCRSLAKKYLPSLASEAFTAGLLHDIGKVVLIQYMAKEFGEALSMAKEQKKELYLVEKELLGVDHGEIGSWLGEKWKLPANLCTAMHHHHYPHLAQEHASLATIVALGDLLCRIMKAGNGGNPAPPRIYAELVQCCLTHLQVQLEPELVKNLVQQLLQEVDENSALSAHLME
jgi:HD-like signal output (HDOD) protein